MRSAARQALLGAGLLAAAWILIATPWGALEPDLNVRQERAEVVIHASRFSQSFIAPSHLSAIDVWVSQAARPATCESVELRLTNLSAATSDSRALVLPGEAFRRAGFVRFEFRPLENSTGEKWRAEFDARDCPGLALSLSAQDSYTEGRAEIAGMPVAGDLAFRTHSRRPLVEALRMGGRVLWQHLGVVSALLMLTISSGLLLIGILGTRIDVPTPSLVLAAPVAGLLMLAPVGTLTGLLGFSPSRATLLAFVAFSAGAAGFLLRRRISRATFGPEALALLVLVAFSLILRLAFLAELTLPPNVDSIEHSLIVRDLMAPASEPRAFFSVERLSTRFYHFGFHGIVALAAKMVGFFEPLHLAVTGQVLLALLPLSMYALMSSWSVRTGPKLLVAGLAAVGWQMPAHGANWAKYPALLAVVCLPLAVSLWTGADMNGSRSRTRRLVLPAFLILSLLLIHTRSVIVLFILVGAAVGSQAQTGLPSWFKWPSIAVISLLAFAGLISPQGDGLNLYGPSTWPQVLARYLGGSGAVLLLLVIFGLTVMLFYRRRDGMLLLAAIVLLFSLNLGPLPLVPTGVLVDRPFLEMMLIVPMLLAVGAGLDEFLRRSWLVWFERFPGSQTVAVGAGVLLILGFFAAAPTGPSDCCQLGRPEAQRFVRESSGLFAGSGGQEIILVPAERWGPSHLAPLDAGGWYRYFTDVDMRPIAVDQLAAVSLTEVCDQGVTYLYLGSAKGSFKRDDLAATERVGVDGAKVPSLHYVGECDE